MEPATRRFD